MGLEVPRLIGGVGGTGFSGMLEAKDEDCQKSGMRFCTTSSPSLM